MKHVKVLFKHHLSVWSNLLVEADLQANPAVWLLSNNARTVLFYLEAMTRLLAQMHHPKKFTKLNERFKCLEDGLGSMDYYAGLLKDFKGNKKIPATIVSELDEQYQTEAFKFNALLREQGWLGNKANRMTKIKQAIKEIDWLEDAAFKDELKRYYLQQIEQLNKQISEPFTDIEAGIHELRRDVRWLSIYPQAFKGLVALKPAVAAQKWQKYCTPEIINSPFNQLPRADDVTDVLMLNANPFYAMSWLIAALGTLKDQGLRLLALSQAWQRTEGLTPEQADERALATLGAGQASEQELLDAARKIAVQVKRDAVFSGLLPK
jgi:hypothetical protein